MLVLFLTLTQSETTDLQGVVVATTEALADPGTISPPTYQTAIEKFTSKSSFKMKIFISKFIQYHDF